MPFTFCHPAIVLPLTKLSRSKMSATGLIIGSMSPDFEYFLKMRMDKVHGHTFEGLFYLDLPLTLILAVVFHLYVRDALIVNLPEVLKKRLLPFVGIDWMTWVKRYWYVLIYSALIGIFSHVFWDAFTHTNGFFVQYIPLLQGWMDVFGVLVRKTDLLQLLSSLFGGMVILFVLMTKPSRTVNRCVLIRKAKYWILILVITGFVLILRNIQTFGDFVATFISGGLISLIATPLLMKHFFKESQ